MRRSFRIKIYEFTRRARISDVTSDNVHIQYFDVKKFAGTGKLFRVHPRRRGGATQLGN